MKSLVKIDAFERYVHYDCDLESAVLGAILLEKDCLINVVELLNEDLFYFKPNKLIYRTIIWMWNKGLAIDILTVVKIIHDHDRGIKAWEEVSKDNVAYYITTLTKAV